MAYGSSDKKKIKTKRISSSSITNSNKMERLVEHFAFVKSHKNRISQHIFNHKITEEVLRFTFHLLKDGQYSPSKMKRENVRIKLTALFEADNERQRWGKFSKPQETSSFRAG